MSADDELEARFLQLGVHYETEFDIEKGLARLRAVDYGLADPKDVAACEPKRQRRAALRARSGDLRSEAGSAPVALEGTLLSDNLVEIDLSKIEGEPTGRALVHVNTPTHRDGLTLLLAVRAVRLWTVLGLALAGLGFVLVLVALMAHTHVSLAVQVAVVAAQFWVLRMRSSVNHLRAPRTSRDLARRRRTKARRKGVR